MANYKYRYEKVSPNLAYLGKAASGSLPSDPVWSIDKLDIVGENVDVTQAQGDPSFSYIWDNRASYIYS